MEPSLPAAVVVDRGLAAGGASVTIVCPWVGRPMACMCVCSVWDLIGASIRSPLRPPPRRRIQRRLRCGQNVVLQVFCRIVVLVVVALFRFIARTCSVFVICALHALCRAECRRALLPLGSFFFPSVSTSLSWRRIDVFSQQPPYTVAETLVPSKAEGKGRRARFVGYFADAHGLFSLARSS